MPVSSFVFPHIFCVIVKKNAWQVIRQLFIFISQATEYYFINFCNTVFHSKFSLRVQKVQLIHTQLIEYEMPLKRQDNWQIYAA